MCLRRIHIVLKVDISIQKTVGRESQEMRTPTSYITENPLSMVLRGNLKKGEGRSSITLAACEQ